MRIAHLSDPHLLDLGGVPPWRLIFNKRLTGYANLRLKRGHAHRPAFVDAILDEVRGVHPDHVAITGDLTNLALEPEFERALRAVRALGRSPHDVSVVPGNHDVYTAGAQRASRFMKYFGEYASSDPGLDRSVQHPSGRFPFLRVRGVALIVGLSSAVSRLPLVASGWVGEAQLDALASALRDPALRDLTPVVLAHHPAINPESALRRAMRGLVDADALRDALLGRPDALSLHGHLHRSGRRTVEREGASLHVLGATSASLEHEDGDRAAAYNVYDLDERGRLRSASARVWDPSRKDFYDAPLGALQDR
ncbi:MAG: metallophosphoesterase [Polyangiales bacterium]